MVVCKYQDLYHFVGSWFSKGEWLFHEVVALYPNLYITIVEVDYSTLYCIKNKTPDYDGFNNHYNKKLNSFLKKYREKYISKDEIKHYPWNDNNTYFEWYMINWLKIYEKYNGFCIFPYPNYKYIKETYKKTNKIFRIDFPVSWDVSSLVLWNKDSVIKYHNLGLVKDIAKLKKKSNNLTQKQKETFIHNLIEKINTINKK